MRRITIAVCQTPDIQNDQTRAVNLMINCLLEAESLDVQLLCFPECFLQGYTQDSKEVRSRALQRNSPELTDTIAKFANFKPTIVFGFIEQDNGKFYNSAAVLERGSLLGIYRKQHLNSGEIFFAPGQESPLFYSHGLHFGVNICYDANFPECATKIAAKGAELILYPLNNMLPRATAEKWKDRHIDNLINRAQETGCWVASADVTGERNNMVGYGPTAIISPDGSVDQPPTVSANGLVVADLVLQ